MSNKGTAIALAVVIFLSTLVTGILPGILAIPRLWLTNPVVKINDTPEIGFYNVKMSGLDEGETIELKKQPANNVVRLRGKLNPDSFGYLSVIVVNNNKIKVFCNNSEASSYKCDTDFKMSSVFKSPNFLYSDCHARIKLRRGNNKIIIISGNAKKTYNLYID